MNAIVVAVSDDKIIGCNHGYYLRTKIGESSFLCGYGGDVAVHPDHRRKGVYQKMSIKKKELREKNDRKLSIRASRNPIMTGRWNKRDRPPSPQTIVNLVRIQDIDKHLKAMPVKNEFLMKTGFTLAKIANNLSNAFKNSESPEENLNIVDIDGFSNEADDFWEEISGCYDFIVERRRGYLNWRYCDPRAGDFVVKQARENGKILGYSVLKINEFEKAYPMGHIVDLLALPDRLDVANALVTDAVNYFDENSVNTVTCLMVKSHPYVNILNRYGFLNSRFKINIVFRARSHEVEEELKNVRKMHFTYGDIDSLP